nr:hypothetical protein BgiMline_006195 [Biomphalaria glabrata]
MPRVYIRKTDKGKVPESVMIDAVTAVEKGMTVRHAAKEFNIARSTLINNIKKAKTSKSNQTSLCPNYQHSLIFNAEQENCLATYLARCSNMFYGLKTKKVRALALEMALVNNIKCFASWTTYSMAGREWLFGFIRLHPELSLRQPEATSLARATAFNKFNVNTFMSIYQLAELGGTAFLKASKKQNILSGFKTSGVWPLDKDIFSDDEFLPSDVTDRPMVADPELPDIDIARPRAHCSSSSPNTDTPFVPDATPHEDTSINVLAICQSDFR